MSDLCTHQSRPLHTSNSSMYCMYMNVKQHVYTVIILSMHAVNVIYGMEYIV